MKLLDEILNNQIVSSSLPPLVVLLVAEAVVYFFPGLKENRLLYLACHGAPIVFAIIWQCVKYFKPEAMARRVGFIRVKFDNCGMNEYVDFLEDPNSAGVVDEKKSPRLKLRNEMYAWRNGRVQRGSTARICFASGESHLGRATTACAGAWLDWRYGLAKGKVFVYRLRESDFVTENEAFENNVRGWSSKLHWLMWMLLFRGSYPHLFIIPSLPHADLVPSIRAACALANKLHRRVFFLVETNERVERDEQQRTEASYHFEPLTASQCERFCLKFAKRNGLEEKLDALQKSVEAVASDMSFGRYALACSGGRPGRLAAFVRHGGRGLSQEMDAVFKEFERLGIWDVKKRPVDLAFLWCLYVEKIRQDEKVKHDGKEVVLDFNEIVSRLNANSNLPLLSVQAFFKTEQLSITRYTKKTFDDLMRKEAFRLPEDVFIASLGSVGKDGIFQVQVATWLRAVLAQGKADEYIDTIASSIVNALQCRGALVLQNGELKAAVARIDRLRDAVGGNPDADRFFAALRARVYERMLSLCFDAFGTVDDESIIGTLTEIFEGCNGDKNTFLNYYRSVLPLLGLMVCNPMALAIVNTFFTHIEKSSINADPYLPEYLGTILLLVFRSPMLGYEDRDRLFRETDGVVAQLKDLKFDARARFSSATALDMSAGEMLVERASAARFVPIGD